MSRGDETLSYHEIKALFKERENGHVFIALVWDFVGPVLIFCVVDEGNIILKRRGREMQ